MRLKSLGLLIVIGIALAPWSKAWAIPAFARDRGVPCTLCHVAFPKLSPFGMMFKQNGYRMSPTEEGKYLWEKKEFPFSGMILFKYINKEESIETTDADTKEGKFELDEVEFFSGGTLSRRFSYFVDLGSEEGEAFEPGGAFLIVNDLAPDALLNLRIGRMDDEFLYLSSARRLTLEDYVTPVSLENTGIEANGFHPVGLRYAVGFGNDETTGEEVSGDETTEHPEVQGYYGWATYTVANQTVGVRYYSAEAGDFDTVTESERHTQIEGNFDLHYGPANLILAYYKQDNVGGVEDVEQTNLLGELIYVMPVMESSQLALSARYERLDTDDPSVDENDEDTQYVLSAAYYPIANLAFIAEYSNRSGDESGEDVQKFQLAAHFGF